jgi:hypothetical protein
MPKVHTSIYTEQILQVLGSTTADEKKGRKMRSSISNRAPTKQSSSQKQSISRAE